MKFRVEECHSRNPKVIGEYETKQEAMKVLAHTAEELAYKGFIVQWLFRTCAAVWTLGDENIFDLRIVAVP